MAVSCPRCASLTWGWLYGLMPESKEHFGLGRHWMRGGVSSVLLVLSALQPTVGRQPLVFAIAFGLAGFAAWLAHRWADPRSLDAAILIGLLWAIGVIPVVGVWPIGPGLALALAALLAWRQARLPGWRDWLRVGEVDTVAWLLCGLTALVSVVGLLAWQHLFSGTLPTDYAYAARSVPVWAAGLGGLGFLIINGVVEDMVFFGVLTHRSHQQSRPDRDSPGRARLRRGPPQWGSQRRRRRSHGRLLGTHPRLPSPPNRWDARHLPRAPCRRHHHHCGTASARTHRLISDRTDRRIMPGIALPKRTVMPRAARYSDVFGSTDSICLGCAEVRDSAVQRQGAP